MLLTTNADKLEIGLYIWHKKSAFEIYDIKHYGGGKYGHAKVAAYTFNVVTTVRRKFYFMWCARVEIIFPEIKEEYNENTPVSGRLDRNGNYINTQDMEGHSPRLVCGVVIYDNKWNDKIDFLEEHKELLKESEPELKPERGINYWYLMLVCTILYFVLKLIFNY